MAADRAFEIGGTLVVAGCGLLALATAAAQTVSILRLDEGTERVRVIARAIREGTSAFLRREYAVLFALGGLLATLIVVAFSGADHGRALAFGFVLGAAGSAAAGALSVLVSVRANARGATIAARGDLRSTVRVTFRAGSVTGLAVAGLAVLVLVACFWWFGGDVLAMSGVLVGASFISLVARVGGGIYTKGADVGADLVGKLERKLPEDDPRNPAVIADNVGDNVGDGAGTAADLFETYLVTAVAAMLLGQLIEGVRTQFPNAVLFPLAVVGCGILATIAGSAVVRMRPRGAVTSALFRGLVATIGVAALGLVALVHWLMEGNVGVLIAVLTGLAVVVALVGSISHYTSSHGGAVARIASSAKSGAGPVVITGLSIGLSSVWIPGLVIAAGTLIAFLATGLTDGQLDSALGLYGIGLAATSMLAMVGMILSLDAFGPIADNAGGIAEMAALPASARTITDALDAAGNTTKAITKGYAIGSSALAALSLFAAFTFAAAHELGLTWSQFTQRLTIDNPVVVVGLMIGALLPFYFASLLMRAVGVAANAVVQEVRRQLTEIPGLATGEARPEYGACVAIVTSAALRQLIAPGILAVVSPLAVGFLLGPAALAGLLLGVVIAGFPLALVLTTSGAAWDNAKKYVEAGHLGGRHSPAHEAAIVGDIVGDATKDAAGPAINPLVKVVNTVALLCVGLVADRGI
ncbi:MAG: sodium-translocating pyrophosphatase [Kofleriaceae bacterium]|nr:sodium-translocating pyrophosphatase [Kofleriaceae bacterium]